MDSETVSLDAMVGSWEEPQSRIFHFTFGLENGVVVEVDLEAGPED
jgi:hypothetical protein